MVFVVKIHITIPERYFSMFQYLHSKQEELETTRLQIHFKGRKLSNIVPSKIVCKSFKNERRNLEC